MRCIRHYKTKQNGHIRNQATGISTQQNMAEEVQMIDSKQGSEPWHIDKRLSLGHLFSTISVIVVLAGFIHKMDTRLAVTEARLEIVEKQVEDNKDQFAKRIQAMTNDLNNRLNRIADKLDKIIIKGN